VALAAFMLHVFTGVQAQTTSPCAQERQK